MCALSTLLTQGNSGANSSLHFAELAQLVERRLAKAKVAGSNPVFRSNSPGSQVVAHRGPGFLLPQRKAKVAGSLGGEKRSWIRRVSSSGRRMPRQGREKRQSCVSSAGSRSPLSRIRILDTNFIIMLS